MIYVTKGKPKVGRKPGSATGLSSADGPITFWDASDYLNDWGHKVAREEYDL